MSAKELMDECTRMLEHASYLSERRDVYNAVVGVSNAFENLQAVYSAEMYVQSDVDIAKEKLTTALIELEYVLSLVDTTLRKRYVTRIRVANACARLAGVLGRNVDNIENRYILAKLRNVVAKTREVVFELTEEDEKIILMAERIQ